MISIFTLVVLTTGCRKQLPDSDPNAWKNDLSLPVPINFGSLSSATKAGVSSLSDLELGFFALEHGDASSIDWTNGNSPSVLLNNISGTVGSKGDVTLDGGPYFYPIDNHRNYSFYGFYPHNLAISRVDDAIYARVEVKNNVDALYARSLAVPTTVGISYSGYNGRYIRKVCLTYPEMLPVLAFEHVTTNIIFNAKANISDIPEGTDNRKEKIDERIKEFTDKQFKITGITINPITKSNGSEVKIPRYGDLCLAVKNSGLDVHNNFTSESSNGHTPGKLKGYLGPNDLGYITLSKKEGEYISIKSAEEKYEMGSFFLVPMTKIENGDKMNITISFQITVVNTENVEETRKGSIDVAIDISGKSFEAGKQYVYNILMYPPEEITLKVKDPVWNADGNPSEEEDIDIG